MVWSQPTLPDPVVVEVGVVVGSPVVVVVGRFVGVVVDSRVGIGSQVVVVGVVVGVVVVVVVGPTWLGMGLINFAVGWFGLLEKPSLDITARRG